MFHRHIKPKQKPTMNHLKLLLATSSFCLLAANSSQASLDAYESFDYTASALDGKNGGTGFSSAWNAESGTDVTAPGSTYAGLSTAGNKALLTPSATSGTLLSFRDLTTTYSSGTVYISFLAQNVNADSDDQRFFGLSLYSGGIEQALIGKSAGTENSYNNWDVSKGATRSASSVDTTTLSLLVARIDFNSGSLGDETISLYVNPNSGVEPLAADASLTSITIAGLDEIRLGAGYTSGSLTTVNGTIDEIRIGTTFSDVAAIPEPSYVGMFISLTAIICVVRRTRIKATSNV